MKKVVVLLICMFYLITCAGCGLNHKDDSREEISYNDTINALCNALDERDSDAIYNLFSPYVKEQDEDLKIQIEKLLSIYAGPTDGKGWDGILGTHESYNYGNHSKEVYTSFPIRSGDAYYWCYLNLMCENTDSQQIGIVQLDFYTADEYCILKYDDKKIVDSVGLTIHADATIENEIRCIEGQPYKYSASTKTLNIDEVRNFLQTSNGYADFVNQFGSPNAKNIYCCYELSSENGESEYLQIWVDPRNDSIGGATVVNEFEYIETIYKTNA